MWVFLHACQNCPGQPLFTFGANSAAPRHPDNFNMHVKIVRASPPPHLAPIWLPHAIRTTLTGNHRFGSDRCGCFGSVAAVSVLRGRCFSSVAAVSVLGARVFLFCGEGVFRLCGEGVFQLRGKGCFSSVARVCFGSGCVSAPWGGGFSVLSQLFRFCGQVSAHRTN